MAEKIINFKIDEETYKEMKKKLIDKDMTIKDYVTNLIKEDLKKDNWKKIIEKTPPQTNKSEMELVVWYNHT